MNGMIDFVHFFRGEGQNNNLDRGQLIYFRDRHLDEGIDHFFFWGAK